MQFSQESDQITHENGLKNDFESKVFSFERQKIGDLREILLDFTLIQMQENVKALEILTEAHRHISDISVDDDLEVKKQSIHLLLNYIDMISCLFFSISRTWITTTPIKMPIH